ncbi:hypothetical protein RND71_005794 [Anisodus tanguticus]|uniref:Translocase of chloroplast 159/132 membrane anchor domain-containing protein n=1 Tax=Anisodus tanguticus TaxID=243964 RepID=A0AAE1SS79_9SOLA|nr:hypothetical protein RND71_005794 [Anisodus tanguticus]
MATTNDLPTDPKKIVEEETGSVASVPVPMPDLALPASFDSDNPTHRYHYLDSSNKWLVRPVLEPNGWDYDVGYKGINVERLFAIKDKIPTSFSSQSIGKDLAYTRRSETRFNNYRKNKATTGLSVTLLGDVMSGVVKVEDKLIVNK